jgi:hypothetical protein
MYCMTAKAVSRCCANPRKPLAEQERRYVAHGNISTQAVGSACYYHLVLRQQLSGSWVSPETGSMCGLLICICGCMLLQGLASAQLCAAQELHSAPGEGLCRSDVDWCIISSIQTAKATTHSGQVYNKNNHFVAFLCTNRCACLKPRSFYLTVQDSMHLGTASMCAITAASLLL